MNKREQVQRRRWRWKKKKWQKLEGKTGETEKDGLNEILTDVKGLKERLSGERHGDKNRIFLSPFGLLNPVAGTDLPYYKKKLWETSSSYC